jgi:5-oxoprolinase (ATP-hydrolysing)
VADLKAQIAANQKGQLELLQLTELNGRDRVLAYMGYLQDHAEEAIRDCVRTLDEGTFSVRLDSGARIAVSIRKTSGDSDLCIDFTGTSGIQTDNQNAPISIVKAAVLYVFRTLVQTPIPLNQGCLRPIKIVVPEDCFLNPQAPSAVVAGNVETSQQLVDVLLGALGKLAGSQGTMNNLTFGNERYQYYETICGGSGAGAEFDGCDAVQTHMTNSRLTDPEVLEWKYPVRVECFEVRQDSGGSGRHRGGNGVHRRIEFLEPMTVGMLSNRRSIAPHGLQGGEDGRPGLNQWIPVSGPCQLLTGSFSIKVKRGDVIQIETPGGGGFGKPSV